MATKKGLKSEALSPKVADRLLELYQGDWQGDVSRIYRDFAY